MAMLFNVNGHEDPDPTFGSMTGCFDEQGNMICLLGDYMPETRSNLRDLEMEWDAMGSSMAAAPGFGAYDMSIGYVDGNQLVNAGQNWRMVPSAPSEVANAPAAEFDGRIGGIYHCDDPIPPASQLQIGNCQPLPAGIPQAGTGAMAGVPPPISAMPRIVQRTVPRAPLRSTPALPIAAPATPTHQGSSRRRRQRPSPIMVTYRFKSIQEAQDQVHRVKGRGRPPNEELIKDAAAIAFLNSHGL